MPKFNFTISPDFKPDRIAAWYIFNTWFQKHTDLNVHVELYNDFEEQRNAIREGKIDMIYANPYDAAMLVNEFGFRPLVKPVGKNDECVIVTSAESSINCIEDLKPGTRIATTSDPDINMIGMRMLEPADLNAGNTSSETVVSFVVVARHVMNENAEIGFFLKEAYDDLSDMIKSRLKVLVTSEISVIYHALMAGPKLADKIDDLRNVLMSMNSDDKAMNILTDLGLKSWDIMSDEDTAFMIDLMDTLRD